MNNNNKILIGIPLKNTGKYFLNLVDQLNKLSYDKKNITISLLEGDSDDDTFDILCKNYTKLTSFRNVYINKLDFGFHLEHGMERYNPIKFVDRIRNLVVSRNFIINNYLNDNDYVWWVDSDFEIIPSNTIEKFIECDKDIVIPMLTHDKWGFHDCGSVVFEGDEQKRFQFIKSEHPLVKLDRTDTHCFIKRKVFNTLRYRFIEEPYYDGCGGKQNCWSDGTSLSLDANKLGMGVYGAQHIVIKHHNV